MKLHGTLLALTSAIFIAAPAVAQQAAPGVVPPTVITPGPGPGAGGVGAPQPPQPTQNQPAGGAQPVPTTVFPPVENIVPGSRGAVVFPPVESITGPGGASQTVLPSPEQTVPGAPGGFPFTEPNLSIGVQQNFQQGAVGNTGAGAINPLGSTLNQNQVFTLPGQAVPGQTVPVIQPPATQGVLLGGNQNLGFSVGPLNTGGGIAGANLPAVPMGLGPGSRPGDGDWIGVELEPFDADEPDALDFSRSP